MQFFPLQIVIYHLSKESSDWLENIFKVTAFISFYKLLFIIDPIIFDRLFKLILSNLMHFQLQIVFIISSRNL